MENPQESGLRGCQVSRLQGFDLATACFAAPIRKGAGIGPHPFLFYIFIISIRPLQMDKFSDFIFPGDASTYGENRQNGGLTRFPQSDLCANLGDGR